MKFWLDDIRYPPDETWVWARSYNEAVVLLNEFMLVGLVIEVAQLDHDLGGMAYNFCEECRAKVTNEVEWHEIFIHGCEHMKTGRHVVEFMKDNNFWPETIVVHSFNHEGAKRMADIAARHTDTYIRPYGAAVATKVHYKA